VRVLHIDTGRELRGGQHQLLMLLEGLAERGHESILLARADSPLSAAAKDDRGRWKVESAGPRAIMSWSSRVDIVHAHDARSHTLAALFSRKTFVASRRVSFPVRTSLASRWKYRKPAIYLAVSRTVADRLQKAGIAGNRIRIVPDGVPKRPLLWRWSAHTPLLTLRTSDPLKGAEIMKAAHLLLPEFVRDEHPFVFSEALERDLPAAFSFLYPSASEGLGSAALLAMSWGVPVIATRAGGLAEIFEDSESGLYVEPTPEAFAAAIVRLCSDPELAMRISKGAYNRVRERFSSDAMVEATIGVYQEASA
jgi:hypothetical protein